MLYGKLGTDFFSTFELLYPNMKIRLRVNRPSPNFYMIRYNSNVSLGIVACSLYTCRIALKDDYHRKGMNMLAYAPVEYNYLETGKDIHHTGETKPNHSRKHFQQASHSSSPDCNEHRLCLHWFFYWKPILV